ncbi:MAG: DUF2971 domain-containing protein [Thermoanaerobaculia bacterium]
MAKSLLRWLVDVLTRQAATEPATLETAESLSETSAELAPKYLYRYCSADRAIQILRDNTLYLCAPDKLNDVFEGAVGSAVKYDPKIARELEIRRYMGLAGIQRAMAEEIVSESSSAAEQRENFEYFAEQLRQIGRRMRQHSGIVCFSASFNDQRMWGTYGDNHAGVCIQFWHDEGRSPVVKHARPVIYTAEARADLLVKMLNEDGSISPSTLGLLFYLTKTTHWRDENEWRIVMLADSVETQTSRTFRFPASSIRRVFLGPRIDSVKRKEIHDLARAHTSDWAIIDVQVDPENGQSTFHGVEILKHKDDFEWHAKVALS